MVLRRFAGGGEQLLQSLTLFFPQRGQGVNYRERTLPVQEILAAILTPDIPYIGDKLFSYAKTRAEGGVCLDCGGIFGRQNCSRPREQRTVRTALVLHHRPAIL